MAPDILVVSSRKASELCIPPDYPSALPAQAARAICSLLSAQVHRASQHKPPHWAFYHRQRAEPVYVVVPHSEGMAVSEVVLVYI